MIINVKNGSRVYAGIVCLKITQTHKNADKGIGNEHSNTLIHENAHFIIFVLDLWRDPLPPPTHTCTSVGAPPTPSTLPCMLNYQ